MATNYATLTSEQRESLNAKRRQKYAQLPSQEKESILAKARLRSSELSLESREAKRIRERIPTSLKRITLGHCDGTTSTIADPTMARWISRIQMIRTRHRRAWKSKTGNYLDWQKDTAGMFPWPNLKAKQELTRLWHTILTLLTPVCSQCQTRTVLPMSWRLTNSSDILAFVPFRKVDYVRVLRRPQDYILLCPSCAFDLRLIAYAWIFSDASPRNSDSIVVSGSSFSGPTYRNWDDLWPCMYPPGQPLRTRIEMGTVRSLTCQIRQGEGQPIYSIIRPNPYYSWVGDQPRDLVWPELERFIVEDTKGTGPTSGI